MEAKYTAFRSGRDTDITLSAEEIVRITQYHQPNRQVDELHKQGFWRARLGRMGEVILERAHYLAVCAGATRPGAGPQVGFDATLVKKKPLPPLHLRTISGVPMRSRRVFLECGAWRWRITDIDGRKYFGEGNYQSREAAEDALVAVLDQR